MKKESREPVFHSRTLFAVFILVFALALLSIAATVLGRVPLTLYGPFFWLVAIWMLLNHKFVWDLWPAQWLKSSAHYLVYPVMVGGVWFCIDMLRHGFPWLQ